ncbi:hypothetical protein RRF57_008919 [Xylaria bambusicola]|uniref:Uncharacterized protein n=1 Tax=Xylaria bambusicola TaxID=326684 RepID=A0AAN7UIP7_9PEZI
MTLFADYKCLRAAKSMKNFQQPRPGIMPSPILEEIDSSHTGDNETRDGSAVLAPTGILTLARPSGGRLALSPVITSPLTPNLNFTGAIRGENRSSGRLFRGVSFTSGCVLMIHSTLKLY